MREATEKQDTATNGVTSFTQKTIRRSSAQQIARVFEAAHSCTVQHQFNYYIPEECDISYARKAFEDNDYAKLHVYADNTAMVVVSERLTYSFKIRKEQI